MEVRGKHILTCSVAAGLLWRPVMLVTKKKKMTLTDRSEPGDKAPAEICELCGQIMERDPESNEYYCPVCDNPDRQE